jgi:hypothetical protein
LPTRQAYISLNLRRIPGIEPWSTSHVVTCPPGTGVHGATRVSPTWEANGCTGCTSPTSDRNRHQKQGLTVRKINRLLESRKCAKRNPRRRRLIHGYSFLPIQSENIVGVHDEISQNPSHCTLHDHRYRAYAGKCSLERSGGGELLSVLAKYRQM